jgi:hypothetical protein
MVNMDTNSQEPQAKRARLIVRDLPTVTYEDFVKKFEKCGSLTGALLLPSKNIGYLQFSVKQDADSTAAALNWTYWLSSKISVKHAFPQFYNNDNGKEVTNVKNEPPSRKAKIMEFDLKTSLDTIGNTIQHLVNSWAELKHHLADNHDSTSPATTSTTGSSQHSPICQGQSPESSWYISPESSWSTASSLDKTFTIAKWASYRRYPPQICHGLIFKII